VRSDRLAIDERNSWLGALAVVLGVSCFLFRFLTFRGFSNDHYEHLARAQQMLLGDLPIRDFNQPGWPLTDALSALAQVLLGRTAFAEVLLVFGCLAVAAALTCWALARLTGSYTVALVMTLLQILVYPRSYSYPKLLLYPIAVIAIHRYVCAPGAARLLGLVTITAVSFLMRHDHGLFVGAGCVTAIAMAHWRAIRGHFVRALAIYAVGTAAVLSPYVAYVQWSGGLTSYLRDALAYSMAEARARQVTVPKFTLDASRMVTWQERLATIYVRWALDVDEEARRRLESQFQLRPVQPEGDRTWRYQIRNFSQQEIERIVNDPSVDDTEGIDRHAFAVNPDRFADACVLCVKAGPGLYLDRNAEVWLYYLAWAAVFGGAVMVVAHRGVGVAPTIAALTVMTAPAAVSFQRVALRARLPDMWGLLPILVGVIIASTWRTTRFRLGARVLSAVLVIVTAGAVAVIGSVREELSVAGVTRNGDAIVQRFREVTNGLLTPRPPSPSPDQATDPSVHTYLAVCTAPTDRILVLASMPELFIASHRGFAAGYYAFLVGFHNSEIHQRTGLARWRAQSVPLAFVYEGDLDRMMKSFPLIVNEMYRRYSVVARVEAVNDHGRFLIFAERNRRLTTTYGPLGAPCYSQTASVSASTPRVEP
jgi:hypothetical protein